MQFTPEELSHAEAMQVMAELSPPEVARTEGDAQIGTIYRLMQIEGFLLKYRVDMEPLDRAGMPTPQMNTYCRWLTTTSTPD